MVARYGVGRRSRGLVFSSVKLTLHNVTTPTTAPILSTSPSLVLSKYCFAFQPLCCPLCSSSGSENKNWNWLWKKHWQRIWAIGAFAKRVLLQQVRKQIWRTVRFVCGHLLNGPVHLSDAFLTRRPSFAPPMSLCPTDRHVVSVFNQVSSSWLSWSTR